MKLIIYCLKYISAYFRISKVDICEMSKDKGMYDFHDYIDTKEKQPWHMCELKCERCGKEFYI